MICIVWEFRIKKGKNKEFEKHYGGSGTWARLFQRSDGYIGTVLLRDRQSPDTYYLFDRWKSIKAFQQFKEKYAEEYMALDRRCEAMTILEREVGIFREIPSKGTRRRG